MTIADRVTTLIARELGLHHLFAARRPAITPQTNLRDDLGADSLTLAVIACAIETEFGISVDEDAEQGWETVADVISNVEGTCTDVNYVC